MAYNISNEINSVDKIINRINLIRIQNNLNQEQLAQKLDISQPAVSKYLKDRIPPAEILLKFARLGGTTIEWLLTGKKQYFVVEPNVIKEESANYSFDIDLQLATKISGLDADAKDTLLRLINILK